MPVPSWTTSDFLGAFIRLLPRGGVWTTVGQGGNTIEGQALETLMPTHVRLTDSAAGLLIDAFPSTTDQLLPEWQATLGLPDPCAGASPTLAQSQAQVVARLTGRGGTRSVSYYISFAAALGYEITITQFAPSKFGRPFGSPFGGVAWAYAWQVNAPQFTVTNFTFGNSQFGQPFAAWGSTVLQCELQRIAPAHTILIFSYVGFYSDGGVLAMYDATGYPQSSEGLAPGAVWWNSGVICVVPGITPNPTASALYVNSTTPSQLLALGGGNLPLSNPGVGTTQLWNNGDVISVA